MLYQLLMFGSLFGIVYLYLFSLSKIRHKIILIKESKKEESKVESSDATTTILNLIGPVVGGIMVIAVSVPVTQSVIVASNLTQISGMSSMVVGVIPAFIALAMVAMVVGVVTNSVGSDGEDATEDEKPTRKRKNDKYFEDGSTYDIEDNDTKDLSSIFGAKK